MPSRGAIATALVLVLLASPVSGKERGANDARMAGSINNLVASAGYLSRIEKAAVDFRRLQTDFMVAALACGRDDFRSKYNSFVRRFRPALRNNGRALRAIFKRTYGRQGQRRLDDFVTRLANEASVRSTDQATFCGAVDSKFNAVLSASHTETAQGLLLKTQTQ